MKINLFNLRVQLQRLLFSKENKGNNVQGFALQSFWLICVCTVLLSLCHAKANAQLGVYTFTGSAACPNINNTVSTQPANAVFSSFSGNNISCVASDTSYINSDYNTGNSIDADEYNEFTITPNTGYLLSLTSLSFDQQVSIDNSPATTWTLRSSIDNYSTDISSGTATAAWQNISVSLSSSFANIGAVTFRLYLTGIASSSDTWNIDNVSAYGSVDAIPAAPANPTSNSPQCAAAGVTLTSTGAPPVNETWYWQASATGTDITNNNPALVVYTAGTYYIRARNNISLLWSDGAGSTTINITPAVNVPVFAAGNTSTRCQGAANIIYPATANNATSITYSLDATTAAAGNSINSSTGEVAYLSGWSGISTITASAAGCNGPVIATHTVTINPAVTTPVFANGSTSTRCQGAGVVSYSVSASNATSLIYTLDATSITAGNNINSSTGEVTFTTGWSGASTITASAAGCNGPATATHTVTTNATVTTPVFTNGNASVRCQDTGVISYTASASNATALTYSLDAASLSAGNTINTTTSAVTYSAGWSGASIITATAAGCNGSATATHIVINNPTVTTPVFVNGNASVRCQGAGVITYTASASNATSLTYSLDAASMSAGNSINASTGAVAYLAGWSGSSVITASAAGCNGPATAMHTVTINPTVTTPVFVNGNASVRCQGAGVVSYTASASNATSLTYSLDAASMSAGNSINASTGDVAYLAEWSGTTVVTVQAAGCNGPLSVTHTVSITPTVSVPVFAKGNTSIRCQGAAAITYTATAANSTALSYSLDAATISGGNSINSSTAQVSYVSGWSGTSVITAAATGCNGPATATHTVTITPTVSTPVFTNGNSSTHCQGKPTASYAAIAANSTSITYSLDAASLAGGNTVNAATGDVSYTSAWYGTSVITATAAGCNGPSVTSHTATITPSVTTPIFAMGNASTRCQGSGTVVYTATSVNATSVQYTLDATSSAGGLSINRSTGAVAFVATYVGNAVVTATASGCNGPLTSTHTITITSSVTIPVFSAGGASTRCQGAGTVSYAASASYTSGITYTLDNSSLTGGNTINAATGLVTYVAGWSGTSIITASAAGCNGPANAGHVVTITASVATPVFSGGASSTRCQGVGFVTYTASAGNSTGITYSLDAASNTAGNTINAASGDVTYVAGWSGTSVITASTAGCNGPKSSAHTVTITATVGTPVFAAGTSSIRCQAAGANAYTASATATTGITYSLDAASIAGGNTISGGTGNVNFAAGWSGTSVVTATAAGCNGPSVSTHTITTNAIVTTPVFASGTSSIRCQGAGVVNYSATANNTTGITYSLNAASIAAGNTINSTTGDVTYVVGWSGTTTVTASAAGCSGPKTTVHTVTVTPTVGTPVFSAGSSSARCQGAGTVTYTSTSSNNTGITYSLDASCIAAGNTINASTGAVTYLAGWTGTSVITASATGCNGPKTATHTVTNTPSVTTPIFPGGATSARCQGAATVTYTATANNTTGITYSLDLLSSIAGNTVNSSTGTVTYAVGWSGVTTITASASGCNGPLTATHTATITATVGTPVFALGSSSSRCQNAENVSYAANASNSTSITYSLDAASRTAGNTIDAATGIVTYIAGWVSTSVITATATGCNGPKTATHSATSTPSVTTPVFAIGATSAICQGSGKLNYIATANNTSGIIYSLDAASTAAGNFIKTNGQLTYMNTWSGTTIVTAIAPGCNGPLSATHTVTVTPFVGTPVFTSGAASTRCQGAGSVTYSATASDNTGLLYALDNPSRTAGNTINTNTGMVTYIASWTGTSVITVTASGCNGPTTSTHTVTITPTVGIPSFAAGNSSIRCQGANTVIYNASSTNSTAITYTLDAATSAGGNSINSATGAVTYSATWTGATTITANAAGCNGPKTATHTVATTATVGTPVFSSGATSTRCQGAGTVTYTATATTNTGLTYSLDAASIAAGCSIAPGTGTVSYAAGYSGTAVITVSATGCNGPKTATHTVTITTNGMPAFTPATSVRCQGAGTVTYTGSAVNNSGVTYSLDAASIIAGNLINSSTGSVTYAATWTGTTVITSTATGCAGVVSATHTVTISPNGTPSFAIGPVSSRLQGAGVIRYAATSNNGAAIIYALDAASLAAGNTINTTTGDVTYVATWNGTTIITAKANGCNGLASSIHTVSMNADVVTKQLYLSDPSQSLDRIDPVVTNDATTANTAPMGLGGVAGTITIDNNASGSIAAATSLTISNFTTGSGNNRYMLVGIASDAAVSSVLYGTQNLTKVVTAGTGSPSVEIWQLVNPPSGAANIVINTSASSSIKAGVTTFAGVHPTTPYRKPATTATGNSTPSTTITSAAGELVYDVTGISNSPVATPSVGQTLRWNITGTSNLTAGSSTKAGAASVTMSWATSTNPNPWSQAVLSLIPAPTLITTTTFVQGNSLCSALKIKAGKTIKVTTYVTVASGTMPAAPAITALLRYGSTNILSLASPAYNSAAGTLTWSGILASDTTVPAGQAIALDITTAQSGVTFTINFDSKTKPSKIDLPVSTYINIDSLGVYNAPYPSGSVIVSAVAGANSYIRATVSDPFGYADITAVNFSLSPSGGTVAATLKTYNSCTAVYEYPWNTGGATGNYTILATAKEGYEGTVTAVQSTTFYFCTTCPPVAVTDVETGAGGSPLLLNVLENDYDPNNNLNPSSLTITGQPQNGSAILSGTKIVYLPNGNFTGKDTLTYQICDLTSPTPLCATGKAYVTIDPTTVDPCSDAAQSHLYYIPYPEADARTALLASLNTGLAINNIRTIISVKIPYPNMKIVWDQWEDGYESNLLSPQQNTTLVWGDGDPYNGIAPGYPNDIIPAGGSIVLDNTMPVNPRVTSNIFYDGRDKIYSSGQITITQVCGEPGTIGLQAMKTNVSSTADFGQSFTVPAGQNFNSQDFKYTSLFIRASQNNTVVSVDKDNNNTFETIDTLNEGESMLVNGGVLNGASIASSAPVGVDLHFGGVDNYSSREAPIYPATWYSNTYYTPVPTTHSPDTAVVMLYNSLSRAISIKWSSGVPSNGTITLPAKGVVRFPLAVSATAAYKFVNPTGEAFTAIEIVDSYTPGGGGNSGSTFDWAFNLISEQRLTTYATVAWAPGSTDGTRNDNPVWVTPANNTIIYVKYDGNVLSGGSVSPCGLHYDVSYPLNALSHKRIFDPTDNDQSGIAVYTCDNTKLAAVYGEDPSVANVASPSWDVGTTIQPFCALKLILANDDQAYTMTGKPVTIDILKNDGGFLSIIDPSSVITAGYLQPKHGTVTVNANGTILYKPDPGFIGTDSLEYSVCSTPSPVVCDVALVFIYINACPTPNNQNIISGQVFLDKNKDGISNDGGTGYVNAKVYLYADGDCNGIGTVNELKDSVITDNSGSYQFLTYPEKTVEDDFDGTGGASTCSSGSDGSGAWLGNWTDAGDPSAGFCVTPAVSYSNTNAEVVKDRSLGYAMRLKNPNVSVTRSVNLAGATAAYFTFSYRRAAAIDASKSVLVQASANGTAFTTIYTIAGNGTSDAGYVTVYNQNLLPYASATTAIRFLTNNNLGGNDTIYIDNIAITYLKYPQCYITKVSPSSIPVNYYFTTASQNAFTATSGGTCTFPFSFGISKTNITISGTLYNDANGLTDGLINGTVTGAPSATTMYAYLVDSTGKVANKTTVNATTGVYTFAQADVLTSYTVMLSTVDSALYTSAPSAARLPAGWVSTGENFGTNNTSGTGNETGAPNTAIAIKTGLLNVAGVNFGIEQLPLAGGGTNTAINPGGTVNVVIPANTFTNTAAGGDISPGTITSIRITMFPVNTTTLTINGTIYTPANFPLTGVVIPATATGLPTQTILADPYNNFVRIVMPFYVIDNAGKESLLPGTALFLLLNDNDRDGIADGTDIDDDNDGITDFVEVCGSGATTFGCLVGGSDPSADNDNDGIVNYKDADFGVLNTAGCVATLDTDGDGIPDYLDLDSDNDGIPDVVEAFGVDVNGDGIIDNYTDTDGDGLSQNVDANNTGAAGSGFGLGFKDFDGDGIPNTLDLDSDNDGIPDVVEAGGADTNNEGTADNFADNNANGLSDALEGAGALLKTGTDNNNDGRADSYPNRNADLTTYPNPYDLDSDGDGITDATEAGFPYWVTISNGKVTGTAVKGWATSIQSLATLSLANTDGRGPANYLDIDSDDDGISDNVEGQSTNSYVVPSDIDTDNDGLADIYDISINTFGGNGLTPYDHDSDGLPDYIDLDTDNDGAADINEASKILNINNTNILTTDADGDGMLDQFDNLNLNTLTSGSRYLNVSNSQMGAGGTWGGPTPSGSTVQLVRSNLSGDRDWRSLAVLPLHVLTLTGKLQHKAGNLTWNVEGEENTAFYTVERSTNGITFSYLATVVSNRSGTAVYHYTDDVTSIFSSKIYYRVVQVSSSGDKQYSNAVILKTELLPEVVMKAYPNPVKDRFTLSVYSPEAQSINVIIMDINGKTVIEKALSVQKGDNSFEFDNLSNLSKGVYMIKAVMRDAYIIRFLKE